MKKKLTSKRAANARLVKPPKITLPNWRLWSKERTVSLAKAAWLAAGIEPGSIDISTLKLRFKIYQKYRNRLETLNAQFAKSIHLQPVVHGTRSVSVLGLYNFCKEMSWPGLQNFGKALARIHGIQHLQGSVEEITSAPNDAFKHVVGVALPSVTKVSTSQTSPVEGVRQDPSTDEKLLTDYDEYKSKGMRYMLQAIRYLQVALYRASENKEVPGDIFKDGRLSSFALAEWLSTIAQKEFGASTAISTSALAKKMSAAYKELGPSKSELER